MQVSQHSIIVSIIKNHYYICLVFAVANSRHDKDGTS